MSMGNHNWIITWVSVIITTSPNEYLVVIYSLLLECSVVTAWGWKTHLQTWPSTVPITFWQWHGSDTIYVTDNTFESILKTAYVLVAASVSLSRPHFTIMTHTQAPTHKLTAVAAGIKWQYRRYVKQIRNRLYVMLNGKLWCKMDVICINWAQTEQSTGWQPRHVHIHLRMSRPDFVDAPALSKKSVPEHSLTEWL